MRFLEAKCENEGCVFRWDSVMSVFMNANEEQFVRQQIAYQAEEHISAVQPEQHTVTVREIYR